MMSSGSITGDDKIKKHTEWKTDFSVISVASLMSDNRMDFQWNEMIKRSKKKHCHCPPHGHNHNWNVFLLIVS